MIRSARRVLVLVSTIVVLTIVGAGPAAAHNALRSTTPAQGQAVATAPSSVVLEFNEPAIAMGTQFVVTGPGGEVQEGAPELVDTTVRQPLRTGLADGVYRVAWRVTSADGHPISGTFDFTVGSGSAPSVGPAPTPPSGGGVPWVAVAGWALGLGSVVVAVIGLTRGLRRRSE